MRASRADDQDGRQVGQVPLDIGVFFIVIRGLRKHQADGPLPPVYGGGDYAHVRGSFFFSSS